MLISHTFFSMQGPAISCDQQLKGAPEMARHSCSCKMQVGSRSHVGLYGCHRHALALPTTMAACTQLHVQPVRHQQRCNTPGNNMAAWPLLQGVRKDKFAE